MKLKLMKFLVLSCFFLFCAACDGSDVDDIVDAIDEGGDLTPSDAEVTVLIDSPTFSPAVIDDINNTESFSTTLSISITNDYFPTRFFKAYLITTADVDVADLDGNDYIGEGWEISQASSGEDYFEIQLDFKYSSGGPGGLYTETYKLDSNWYYETNRSLDEEVTTYYLLVLAATPTYFTPTTAYYHDYHVVELPLTTRTAE